MTDSFLTGATNLAEQKFIRRARAYFFPSRTKLVPILITACEV